MADNNLPKPTLPTIPPAVPSTPPGTPPPPATPTPTGYTPAPPVATTDTANLPPIRSRFLDNLQSINPTPFQSAATPGASAAAALPTSPVATNSPLSSPPNSPPTNIPPHSTPSPTSPAAAVPPEQPQFIPTPPPSAKGSSQSSSVSGNKAIVSPPWWRKPVVLGSLIAVLLLMVGGVFAWNWWQNRRLDQNTNNTKTTVSPRPQTPNVTLTYWGLWEPLEVMQPVIAEYERTNPGVKITYVQQKSDQYRQRVQAAIQDGSGPDIFRYHNTWMPMVESSLAPAPKTIFPQTELTQNYYPLMARQLVRGNNEVYGVPLMFEGLALVYNQTMLEAAGAQPPQDWEQVRLLANRLTIRRDERLERGGIALGLASNVDHFSDILGLMMRQNSAEPGDPTNINAQHALEFFTLFSRVDRVWDETMPPSTQAFANEQVAMIIVPSWRIFDIQKANPNIKIGVTRLPQLTGEPVTWGTYWVEGVSVNSRSKEEAWKFLQYLAQPDILRKLHTQAGTYRAFGELYPRVDMAESVSTNPYMRPYLDDALYAQTWFMAGATHDEGLNDEMIQYYTDAVNATNKSGNAEKALRDIAPGIQQVLTKYKIPLPSSTSSTP